MKDHYQCKSPVTGEIYDPKTSVRYSEIPTFMRAPLASDLSEIDIALVGVPFDIGVTNRGGARHGPREIRNMSSLVRLFHPVTRVNPFDLCRVADVGDVRVDNAFHIEAAIESIKSFFWKLHNAGVVPLTAGGDHSITYPILEAIATDKPIGLIHIDAHTDTSDTFLGSNVHHGAPFRRAVESGFIDPMRTIQIGIRGAQNTTEGWEYSLEKGMRVIFMDEVDQLGIDKVVEEARRVVGNAPVYLTFDVDGIDPAFTPGTGTPEVGGLTTREALALLRGLRGLNFVGADVVEVSPPFDNSGNTALVGATLMYEILCLLVETAQK